MVRDEGVQVLHVFLNLLEDVDQRLVLFLDPLQFLFDPAHGGGDIL
jgi:hypothetical protein